MLGWLGKRRALDPESAEWIFSCFRWAMAEFGADIFFRDTRLITPTDSFFPERGLRGTKLAEVLFHRVREYSGMGSWECQLVAQEPDANPFVGSSLIVQGSPKGPAGTWSHTGDKDEAATITYNPSQLHNPESLIATFAHELAHYLGATSKTPPPGGEPLWEPATDLLAVFMGFGTFMTNSSFSFRQFSTSDGSGWESRQQGYLSQMELCFSLAVFTDLKSIAESEVRPFLASGMRGFFRKSRKDLARNPDSINHLRQMRPSV